MKAHLIFLIIFSLITVGCGKKTDDEILEDALNNANRALSNRDCQTAIDALEAIGRKNFDARYLIVLASAYACRGGYNELILFANDFGSINVSNALGGLTLFSTSDDMTSPGDSDYTDLQTAFNILVFAGGLSTSANPDSDQRRAIFGNAKGGDIDAFIMYISMVQLGRFLRYYGNIDTSTGQKGGGAASHNCLLNYQNIPFDVGGDISTLLGGATTGNCNALDDGNDELGLQGGINVERSCQGVILLNNFLNVLPAVLDSYTGNELDEIEAIITTLQGFDVALLSALGANPEVASVRSQDLCESQNAASQDFLEIYYAIRFEQLFL